MLRWGAWRAGQVALGNKCSTTGKDEHEVWKCMEERGWGGVLDLKGGT